MANDSTELTFVRCPSCRSLVPAMSSRCRMCGATLDSVGKPQATPPAENLKSGRVRQKTMSDSGEELAVESGEQPLSPGVETPKPSPEPLPKEPVDVALDDPLQAFVEEVPIESLEPSNGDTHREPNRPAQPKQKVAREGERDDAVRPQVVVEHGRGKPGGLSFGKPSPESRQEDSSQTAQRDRPKDRGPQDRKPETVREERKLESDSEQRESPRRDERPPRGNNAADALRALQERQEREVPKDVPDRPTLEREKRREEVPGPQRQVRGAEQPARPERGRGETPSLKQDGRLFGWLVNYENPNGLAIELREGRFFICGTKFKDSDMIIDHPSVSTPHAMARVSIDHGLEVQDLMSDGGVFVKRKDSGSFKREDDRVKVGHGDWLRIGEVEYLVSLIAQVGKR